MLDDNERVAEVAQVFQQTDESICVARVQPDAWLVEHIKHVDQFRAEAGGEVDALGFAAGERARRPVEREVAKADAHHRVEPPAHLGQHRRECIGPVEVEPVGEFVDHARCVADGEPVKIGEREPVTGAGVVELEAERVRLETLPLAPRARCVAAVAREQNADVHLVRLALQPAEITGDSVPCVGPGAARLAVVRLAVGYPVARFFRQLVERQIGRDAILLRGGHHLSLALDAVPGLPRLDDAPGDRLGEVRHREPVVDRDDSAEALALRAGADWVVETEQ